MTNDTQQPKETSTSIPVKWGVISAIVMVFLMTCLYLFMTDNFIVFGVTSVIVMLVPIIFFSLAASQQKKMLGGYIEFKNAFRAVFIAIVLTVVIYNVYDLIYTNFIDPDYADRLKVSMSNFIDKADIPDDQADQMLSDFEEKMDEKNTAKSRLVGPLTQIIIYSIFGFIIAAIVKKKKPNEVA